MIIRFNIKETILLILICLSLNSFSQSTFNINIGTEEDESYPIIEIYNDSYLILYNIAQYYGELEGHKARIDNITNEGEANNIHSFANDTIDFVFGNIIKHEHSYYCHGLQKHIDSTFYRNWIFKMDEDLSIVWQKTYESPFDGILYETEMTIIHENIIISRSSYINNNAGNQFLKFNLDGDLIHEKTYNTYKWEIIYDILKEQNPSSYNFNVFGMGFNLPGDVRLTLDSNFNIINEVNSPVTNEQDAEWINDSLFILCGSVILTDTIFITTKIMDTNSIVYQESIFTHQTSKNQHVGVFNGQSYIDENKFYLGGFTHANIAIAPTSNYLMLNKLNTSLTPEWQKFYGGDARYVLFSIKTTPDGGCIMAGSRYDWNTQYNERDIFVMKVDENGLITSINNEDFQVADAIVYPNPGTNRLQIQSAFPLKEIRMMDVNGRMVLQQPLNNLMDEINVSLLNAGTYIYQIIGRDGKVQHGKWVKM
ncbi:MAG: T9SS type A sorting domain-containing protein [Bacteroidales bacterium]|nr:T9SS type A sorting domain-containing protein [Bacteroidales bacterium]